MKKTILTVCLFLLAAIGLQAEETTDYITLSATKAVNPGGDEVTITVNLAGSENYYAGYNMDIHLPLGVELAFDTKNKPKVKLPFKATKEDNFYPSTEEEPEDEEEDPTYSYSHSISTSYGTVGDRVIRIACFSSENESFLDTSGKLFTFTVKATPYAKPGAADILIDGVALKVAGGAEYDPVARTDQNITIGTSSTTTLSISSTNKWSTCILPFDATLPTGVRAFSCAGTKDAEYLALTEESSIVAYTPYIVYAEEGYSGPLSGTVDAKDYAETKSMGYLTGAIAPQQITSGYVLQNKGEGAMFYRILQGTFNIPSGKCWLSIPQGSNAYHFGDATGISTVSENKKNTTVHDLSGRPVEEMKAGELYIVNGQTILNLK